MKLNEMPIQGPAVYETGILSYLILKAITKNSYWYIVGAQLISSH